MPAIAAAPLFWGAIAGGGMSVAGSVIGGKMSSNASKRAARTQADAMDKQIAFERERDAEDTRRFEETQRYNREQAEIERLEDLRRYEYATRVEADRWNAEQTRRTPYRRASTENLEQLAGQTRAASLADLARATR